MPHTSHGAAPHRPPHADTATPPPQAEAAAQPPVAQLLMQALALRQAGRLAEAEAINAQLVREPQRHAEALVQMGMMAGRSGHTDLAEDFFRAALVLRPDDALLNYNHGVMLQELGRTQEALDRYDHALALRPDLADAHDSRGVVLQMLRRFDEALASHDAALRLQPDAPAVHSNRGAALQALRRFDEALASYDRALIGLPDSADVHSNRGVVLRALGRSADAVASYDRALALDPDHAEAYSNRGLALQDVGRRDDALADHDQAVARRPNDATVYNNRGVALQAQGLLTQARADYDRALRLRPDYCEALSNRGALLRETQQCEAALADFDAAIQRDPTHVDAHWNKALTLLVNGRLAEGWPLYEWRWRNPKLSPQLRGFTPPLWLGQVPVQGRTLLLHSEQGLGDTLQFCRYAPLLAAQGARVLLEVPPPLVSLLQTLDGVAAVIPKGQDLPPFDFHTPLMSLPLACGTTLDTIPNATPYLFCDADLAARWQARLGPRRAPRVGLVWSGNPQHREDRHRSLSLAQMLAALPPGLDYVSLQKDVRPLDQATLAASPQIRHFGDLLHDFADTAALCGQMDVVVSVDTSVAHLAAAFGRPTWVLVTHVPDWRWLLGREDSPWYPGMRLFRQGPDRDWAPVLCRIAEALAALRMAV